MEEWIILTKTLNNYNQLHKSNMIFSHTVILQLYYNHFIMHYGHIVIDNSRSSVSFLFYFQTQHKHWKIFGSYCCFFPLVPALFIVQTSSVVHKTPAITTNTTVPLHLLTVKQLFPLFNTYIHYQTQRHDHTRPQCIPVSSIKHQQ